jgi:hypothetical protein
LSHNLLKQIIAIVLIVAVDVTNLVYYPLILLYYL